MRSARPHGIPATAGAIRGTMYASHGFASRLGLWPVQSIVWVIKDYKSISFATATVKSECICLVGHNPPQSGVWSTNRSWTLQWSYWGYLLPFVYVVHKQETQLSYSQYRSVKSIECTWECVRDFRPCRYHPAVDWSDWADAGWRKDIQCFLNILEQFWTIFQHVTTCLTCFNRAQPKDCQSLHFIADPAKTRRQAVISCCLRHGKTWPKRISEPKFRCLEQSWRFHRRLRIYGWPIGFARPMAFALAASPQLIADDPLFHLLYIIY
jgi:hypothetical protein